MTPTERQERIAEMWRDVHSCRLAVDAGHTPAMFDHEEVAWALAEIASIREKLEATVTREEIEALPGYSVQIAINPATYTGARLMSDIAQLFIDKADATSEGQP